MKPVHKHRTSRSMRTRPSLFQMFQNSDLFDAGGDDSDSEGDAAISTGTSPPHFREPSPGEEDEGMKPQTKGQGRKKGSKSEGKEQKV